LRCVHDVVIVLAIDSRFDVGRTRICSIEVKESESNMNFAGRIVCCVSRGSGRVSAKNFKCWLAKLRDEDPMCAWGSADFIRQLMPPVRNADR
jgi:hypothetical protein